MGRYWAIFKAQAIIILMHKGKLKIWARQADTLHLQKAALHSERHQSSFTRRWCLFSELCIEHVTRKVCSCLLETARTVPNVRFAQNKEDGQIEWIFFPTCKNTRMIKPVITTAFVLTIRHSTTGKKNRTKNSILPSWVYYFKHFYKLRNRFF